MCGRRKLEVSVGKGWKWTASNRCGASFNVADYPTLTLDLIMATPSCELQAAASTAARLMHGMELNIVNILGVSI